MVDYIIVGAGSAGCVLANRLSENGKHNVLLLEAGGRNKSIMIDMPTALSYPMASDKYNWGYNSDPEPGLDGRRITCPRGKGLGGSSAINGMVYVRGHHCDFNEWAEAGAAGWAYRDCLPYFKRAETWAHGADDYRGGSGPLKVGAGNEMKSNPLYQAFIDAGVEAGYPKTQDYNGYAQEGFGAMHMTVGDGVRSSTARAYLESARSRNNLQVITGAEIDRVIFNNKRATGVAARVNGETKTFKTEGEIILAAGAIASPSILQRSGVGEPAFLKDLGIEPLHEFPVVGANLQDHLEVYFQFHCKKPVSLNDKLDYFSKFLIGARWFFFKSGLGATNHFESCAFIKSKAGLKSPDIQYHFLPAAMRYDGTSSIKGHGFQVHVGPNKPKSRGRVAIAARDMDTDPSILFNYLEHDDDIEAWRQCIKLTREIMAQPAMDEFRGPEIQPGDSVQSNDEIDGWVRENVESAYHPCGTCRMGDDGDAVVDTQCRVNGVEKLRVVDASIFPTAPYGNINAPVIMAAEKAADLILGKAPLPPEDPPLWIDPEWQTRQRPGAPKR
ncbi:MAG: choline dehydrogenase [Marinicaulis sp.]|nr:choline dehydrogenase [Marinicaulis sp.]